MPGSRRLGWGSLMSSDDVIISVKNLSKRFEIFDRPADRLRQFLLPRLQKLLGLVPRQYFREFWALNDISFEVRRGETIGIIGKNGSGKSTLLQMICGTLTPTIGEVNTRGRIAALLELGSGFNPEFTGRENVYMNASVLGLSNIEIDERFEDIVLFADIGDFIDQPVKTYSSGMMLRLAFSVIVHVDADILVIDEALAVGDTFFTQKCMRFLRDFKVNSGTLIFVSHDIDSVLALCDSAIWLDLGLCMDIGQPKEISERYIQNFLEKTQSVLKNQTQFTSKEQRISKKDELNERQNLESSGFGDGRAKIVNIGLVDESGYDVQTFLESTLVTLSLTINVYEDLNSLLVGFYVKNKWGQSLFGDNTYETYKSVGASFLSGAKVVANFSFIMPRLPAGDYSVTVAVADGDQINHIHNHWVHDGLFFKSIQQNSISGLIGIPIKEIVLKELM